MQKVVISTTDERLWNVDKIKLYEANQITLYFYVLVQEQYRTQRVKYVKFDWVVETDQTKYPPLVGKTTKYGPHIRNYLSDVDLGNETEIDPQLTLLQSLIEPTNPILVKMCENGELGKDFKVVEIPDAIEWYIDDIPYYYESTRQIIRQKHLIWD